MSKVINAKVTEEDFVAAYLTLFAHGFSLTNQEFKALEQITKVYRELDGQVQEPFLTELVLSTDRRTKIRKELKVEESSFNNVIASLKKKSIITDKGLNPLLLPRASLTFNFNIIETPVEVKTKEEVVTEEELDKGDSMNVIEVQDEDSTDFISISVN